MQSLYQKALVFATKAHQWQTRRDGRPYILHPIRVSQMVDWDVARCVAILHDVVEDTDVSLDDIKSEFGVDIAIYVSLLTRKEDQYGKEAYRFFIGRVCTHKIAIQVKIADITDNLRDAPTEKQMVKYAKALETLVLALNEME